MTAIELMCACAECRQLRENVIFEHRHGGDRQQADDRAHLEALGAAVRQPQHVVEESVFLVPHFVVVLAHAVHGPRDRQGVTEEFLDKLLVVPFMQRELDGNTQHLLAEEHHPRRPVRLIG